MQVQVEQVFPEPNATMWQAWGTDVEDDTLVRFAGDWRPMREVWIALKNGVSSVIAEVPDWAVIRYA